MCVSGTCDPINNCIYTADNSKCDDSIDCTSDVCNAQQGCSSTVIPGYCTTASVPAYSGPCYTASCSVAYGSCVFTPVSGCQPNPVPVPSTMDVVPILDCIQITSSGYSIYLSYSSTYTTAQSLPVGVNNSFSPAPNDRGQPTTFSSGTFSYPFSPCIINVITPAVLTWTLGSTSIQIDPTDLSITCPTTSVVQFTVTTTTTPSSVNQGQKLSGIQTAISSSVGSNVTVSKVGSTDTSEIYSITFTGTDTSSQVSQYCTAMNGQLKTQINQITSGTVSDTGCSYPSDAINSGVPAQTGSPFLWWYGVIIGAGVLVIIIIIIVVVVMKNSSNEIV